MEESRTVNILTHWRCWVNACALIPMHGFRFDISIQTMRSGEEMGNYKSENFINNSFVSRFRPFNFFVCLLRQFPLYFGRRRHSIVVDNPIGIWILCLNLLTAVDGRQCWAIQIVCSIFREILCNCFVWKKMNVSSLSHRQHCRMRIYFWINLSFLFYLEIECFLRPADTIYPTHPNKLLENNNICFCKLMNADKII